MTAPTRRAALLTVGHGRLDRDVLGPLLQGGEVGLLVDVRRFPGSRSNPDVARDALPQWLPGIGIEYRWEERLGGRRSLPAEEDNQDTWWKVKAFRAYAAHTRTPEFSAAMDELLADVTDRAAGRPGHRVAVMCSESVWWRCHRRIIADVAVLGRDTPVSHLMHDGRLTPHEPVAGARVRSDGLLIWDGQ